MEAEVVREELANPEVLFWLRVPPRKDWSFCVPFTDGTAERPLYPDFLFVRQDGDRLLMDIIDPHDPGLEDAARKAAGLASYAQRHGHLVGRIDLVARIDGHLSRIHLKDDTSREAVAAAMTPNALRLLSRTRRSSGGATTAAPRTRWKHSDEIDRCAVGLSLGVKR